ncbi:MAG TPA: helix-turn-helix domain-containing protein [Fimbriimonadaceae bacterium]|nr:helix-turn-helix domain-containing protein [Fimbriimonadaceae bacterium]
MKPKKDFDPLAYIESAFLDSSEARGKSGGKNDLDVDIPSMGEYLHRPGGNGKTGTGLLEKPAEEQVAEAKGGKFRKTVMSAPRPRRAKQTVQEPQIDPALQTVWEALPKNIEFLCSFYDDSVTSRYYRGEFKENRQELIRRLLDPELSLEETSRLLGVCPATVRRYTNRNWLAHHRTTGGQRRFRLSDIVRFVEIHGRFPEG